MDTAFVVMNVLAEISKVGLEATVTTVAIVQSIVRLTQIYVRIEDDRTQGQVSGAGG